MIKGDSIYQVLLKHDFDLLRDNEEISTYMEKHLNGFLSEISSAIKGKNDFLGKDFIALLDSKKMFLSMYATRYLLY